MSIFSGDHKDTGHGWAGLSGALPEGTAVVIGLPRGRTMGGSALRGTVEGRQALRDRGELSRAPSVEEARAAAATVENGGEDLAPAEHATAAAQTGPEVVAHLAEVVQPPIELPPAS